MTHDILITTLKLVISLNENHAHAKKMMLQPSECDIFVHFDPTSKPNFALRNAQ